MLPIGLLSHLAHADVTLDLRPVAAVARPSLTGSEASCASTGALLRTKTAAIHGVTVSGARTCGDATVQWGSLVMNLGDDWFVTDTAHLMSSATNMSEAPGHDLRHGVLALTDEHHARARFRISE